MGSIYPSGYTSLSSAIFIVTNSSNQLPDNYTPALLQANDQAVRCFKHYLEDSSKETQKEVFYSRFLFFEPEVYMRRSDPMDWVQLEWQQAQIFKAIHHLYQLKPKIAYEQNLPKFGNPNLSTSAYEFHSSENNKTPYLPGELWKEIFKRAFTNRETIGSVARVCKHFYGLVTPTLKEITNENPHFFTSAIPVCDSALISQLLFRGLFNGPRLIQEEVRFSKKHLQCISTHNKNIQTLKLMGNEYTPQELAAALDELPDITSIEFKCNASENFDEYIFVLSRHAKQITALKVVDCPHMSDESLLVLMHCSCLTSFTYQNSKGEGKITDFCLLPLINSVSLSEIHLSGCPLITQIPLTVLIMKDFDQLKTLEFNYCGLVNKILLKLLAQCKNLTKLSLCFSENQNKDPDGEGTAAFEAIFRNCPLNSLKIHGFDFLEIDSFSLLIEKMQKKGLRSLDIQDCCLDQEEFHQFCLYQSLACCEKVEELCYVPPDCWSNDKKVNNAYMTVEELFQMVSHGNLKTLEIGIKANDLQISKTDKLNKNKRLTNLTLHWIGKIEGLFFENLAQITPNLANLTLLLEYPTEENSLEFNQVNILMILGRWPELKCLHMQSTPDGADLLKVPTDLLDQISLSHPHITELTIEGLQADPTFQPPNFTYLVHLGLPKSQFTPVQFIELMHANGRHLRSLDLSQCPWFNDDLLEQLPQLCPFLKYLNIDQTSASKECVDKFVCDAPYLQYLKQKS